MRDREDPLVRMVHPERTELEDLKDSPDQVDNLDETDKPAATVSPFSLNLNSTNMYLKTQ